MDARPKTAKINLLPEFPAAQFSPGWPRPSRPFPFARPWPARRLCLLFASALARDQHAIWKLRAVASHIRLDPVLVVGAIDQMVWIVGVGRVPGGHVFDLRVVGPHSQRGIVVKVALFISKQNADRGGKTL